MCASKNLVTSHIQINVLETQQINLISIYVYSLNDLGRAVA